MKKTIFLIFYLITNILSAQELQSPEVYMGQKMGERFNFHHKLNEYVRYVASVKTSTTKLISYGSTTEGRPQVILAIGSEENIKNLEDIRLANLKNCGLVPGQKNTNIPTIAMLSYNVHGNEAVNAETAVHVIFEMANAISELSQKVLKNTVVLIDPCVNPDGFDRYSTWYNRYVSNIPNVNPAAAEHHEPWPGGRFNHYLYDMNRDLAWQTQKEVQNRMKFYNSWMPHLHADFHEMGANSTYYFPPSAKPFHEDINTFQRYFQNLLGKYNSKRFDEKGWLYYTKENYDLFYPSYGDTYPTYNGAIGMTFEQGGGGQGGLGYLRKDGDTLTLNDRIQHSYSTSLGTLEAISDNSQKVIEEYIKFFDDPSKKGFGKYKSYIMKYTGNEAKISALTAHLDKLSIKYSFADKKSLGQGYSFESSKDESFAIEENDLIVNSYQPKGILTKILFEPVTILEDSNTYDITAWALPYAYDIKSYAVTQKIEGSNSKILKAENQTLGSVEKVYAYAVAWESFNNAKFLADILKAKVKVRVQESPFTAGGKSFKNGSLLITRKGNENLGARFESIVSDLAKKHNITINPLTSGLVDAGPDMGANSVQPLNAPKVALMIGDGVSPTGAGDVWHYFEQQLNYPVTLIDGSYFSKIDLWSFDVLVLPAGKYSNVIKDTKEITRWISDGGRLILLESANNLFAGKEGIELKNKKGDDKSPQSENYGDRERFSISDQIPGAIYKIKLDNTHPLAYGYSDHTFMLVKDVYNYEYLANGWNVGKLESNSLMSGFVGSRAKNVMKDVPIFAVQDMGKGKIIHLVENPIFRGFWYGGKLLFANAVFMVK